jgi:hypothetical protein
MSSKNASAEINMRRAVLFVHDMRCHDVIEYENSCSFSFSCACRSNAKSRVAMTMVRVTTVTDNFVRRQFNNVRNLVRRNDSDNDTVATVDDEPPRPITARERSIAAIEALRREENKMVILYSKISIFLIAFPIVSYYIVKWTGVLDNHDSSQPPQNRQWNRIAFENLDRVSSMAMSGDGSILAIGDAVGSCVTLYTVNPWQPMDEICDSSSNLFGSGVSLSEDGSIIAINSVQQVGERPGFVRTYQYSDAEWVAIGQDLVGQVHGDFFGTSMDLSGSGNVLAIGTAGSTVSLLEGKVDVYRFNSTRWNLMGASIRGLENPDRFGDAVSLSRNGDLVAIGAPSLVSNGTVEVHRLEDGGWRRVAAPIPGQFQDEALGQSVSVAAVGETITIAASSRSLPDTPSRVQVFEAHNHNNWTQIKNDLVYSEADEIYVDISADGAFLAIGAHQASYLCSTNMTGSWEDVIPFPMLGDQQIAVSTNHRLRVAAAGKLDDRDFVVVYEESV